MTACSLHLASILFRGRLTKQIIDEFTLTTTHYCIHDLSFVNNNNKQQHNNTPNISNIHNNDELNIDAKILLSSCVYFTKLCEFDLNGDQSLRLTRYRLYTFIHKPISEFSFINNSLYKYTITIITPPRIQENFISDVLFVMLGRSLSDSDCQFSRYFGKSVTNSNLVFEFYVHIIIHSIISSYEIEEFENNNDNSEIKSFLQENDVFSTLEMFVYSWITSIAVNTTLLDQVFSNGFSSFVLSKVRCISSMQARLDLCIQYLDMTVSIVGCCKVQTLLRQIYRV